MRKPALLVGLVLTACVLTGCGGGDDAETGATDTETYCDQLKADKSFLDGFTGGDADPSQIKDAIKKFHALTDAAPEEIAPDWDVVDGAFTEIERGLAEAGISTEDLAGLQKGEVPKGVDVAKLTKLLPKVQALQGKEVQDSVTAIRTHAKEECGVTLGEGDATP
jgi:hypothetical protein